MDLFVPGCMWSKNLESEIYNKINMEYGKSSHYEGKQGVEYYEYQNRAAVIRAKLNARKFTKYIKKSDTVLDFGCGGGWLLAELVCAKKIGVELNKAAHEDCRGNGIEVVSSTEEIPSVKFDVIISHHCIEHVPYPIAALACLKDLLKEDGIFILYLPLDDWRVQKDYSIDIDHHLHTWTSRCLANTLRESGFIPSEIRVVTHSWFKGWSLWYSILHPAIFDFMCYLWSVVMKRRQLMAVSKPRSKDSR